ncbi:MAG: transposase family protein [Myxococcales bacterium]|nr:MAG: transposase family protein [Myxococcales bacterium]
MAAECSTYGGYFGPNACWSADYKGEFALSNHRLYYPLTICDVRSRYLLKCKSLPHTRTHKAKKVFEKAFCEYSLPDVIRTDNGAPFASLARAWLSELSIWWLRLGIRPHRIDLGRPTQQGRHP